MSRSFGTGSPIFFRCSRCKKGSRVTSATERTGSVIAGQVKEIDRLTKLVQEERAGTVSSGAATPGAYRWIESASKLLKEAKRLAGKSMGKEWDDGAETLLMGVPVPPEDLGFDSPADRYARAWHALNSSAAPAEREKITNAVAYRDQGGQGEVRVGLRFGDDTELDLPIADFLAWLKKHWSSVQSATEEKKDEEIEKWKKWAEYASRAYFEATGRSLQDAAA